jgi:hypothetical protein
MAEWKPPPEPVTWTIKPVNVGTTTYSSVTLRAPTPADILKATANARENSLTHALRLISAISEEQVPFEALLNVPTWQIEQMSGYFESFSGAPLPDPLRAARDELSEDTGFRAA